jgi:chromosome segregation ATPase
LGTVRERLVAAESAVDATSAELVDKSKRLQLALERASSLELELADRTKQATQLTASVSRLEDRLRTARQECASVERALASSRLEATKLLTMVEEHGHAIDGLSQQREGLLSRLRDQEAKSDQLIAELRAQLEENVEARERVQVALAEVLAAQVREVQRAEAREDQLRQSTLAVGVMEQAMAQLTTHLQEVKGSLEDRTAALAAAEAARDDWLSRHRDLDQQHHSLLESLHAQNQALLVFERNAETLAEEMRRLDSEITAAFQREEQMAATVTATNATLEQTRAVLDDTANRLAEKDSLLDQAVAERNAFEQALADSSESLRQSQARIEALSRRTLVRLDAVFRGEKLSMTSDGSASS